MGFEGTILWIAGALCAGLVGSVEAGYRLGKRHLARSPEAKIEGSGAVDNAVFAILGLILAFTFTGALTRFDQRRQLILKEANAIGTAYLRLDLLPAETQAVLRPIYREYVQTRLDLYRGYEQQHLTQKRQQLAVQLQNQIWQTVTEAVLVERNPGITTLVLASTNDVIDVANERLQATRMHPPVIVYVLLFVLALASALLVGYNMAANQKRSFYHIGLFCLVITTIVTVTIDLEYPRRGFIRISIGDRVMEELADSLK
ncbi:MAG: hypothetical protein OHK0012_26390 [Synechococcales cyanobacterium]